jgi:hypothetical protein
MIASTFEFLVLEGTQAGLSWTIVPEEAKVIGALSMGLIPRKWRDIRFDESIRCAPSATASQRAQPVMSVCPLREPNLWEYAHVNSAPNKKT